jgi:hypothetical protein
MHNSENIHQDQKWNTLYRISGFTIIIMLILIPVQILVFSLTSIPDSIEGWFNLYNDNWILGLIHQDFLYIINNVIVAIMYLALYMKLKSKIESIMLLAISLGILGIGAYFASNRAYELLNLSNQYNLAETITQKSALISAGQSLLLGWQGTAFLIYYILNGIALILISWVMLKNPIFGKKTAIIGLIAGLLMIIPSTFGTVGIIFSLASLIPWYIFSILISREFLRYSRYTE